VILSDQDARDRIAEDLASTLVVEAAAGTGETTALVSRIVSLAGSGLTQLRRVVAVTFTEKAAGEMKLRLRGAIEEARQRAEPAVRARLDQALEELEAARIGTIHSLCADLLRERPVEAGIDPMFEVAAESESGALFDAAFEEWFQAALADPPEGVRRLLRRPASGQSSPRALLRTIGMGLKERRDFPGPWRRDAFDRDARLSEMMRSLQELAVMTEYAGDPEDYLARCLWKIKNWVDAQHRAEEVRARDFDGLESALRGVKRWREWSYKGSDRRFGPQRAKVIERRDQIKADLDALVAACDADLAPLLDAELRPLVERYEQLKARSGKLDFLDLLGKTRDMLVENGSVRRELQRRFSHLLVDEFQDTDPLQAEIVLLLAAADPDESDPAAVRVRPGKLFLVGDPKQSIYRFRRADIAIYEGVKQRLLAQGAILLHLSVSFRADPRIQATVNAAFAPRMRGEGQAQYVPLESFREQAEGVPAVIALPVPAPYSPWGKLTGRSVDESLPWAVGAWIDWLVNDSGRMILEPGSKEPVPVQARHVCLLFRRFQTYGRSVTTPYTRELETRGIAHVLVGGRSFHDREETMVMRNALSAIEWPDDELAVFATLKGPLFAVPDDALLAYKAHFASTGRLATLNPLRNVDEEVMPMETADAAEALAVLRALHRRRNRRPIAETIGELLEITRAHAGFAIWNAGEQVLANVLRVADLARRFERSTATSFRSFVEHLAAEADRGEAPQAPVVEEGTEGVRLMTVHKAKGLEFPVVVLCDITARSVPQNPSRLVVPQDRSWFQPLAGCVPVELAEARDEVLHRDAEESDRLLYVAATRARDILVIPAVGDDAFTGWIDALNPTLYPEPKNRRRAVPAPGCPEFGKDSVGYRPPKAPSPAASVHPGLHRSGVGTEVVWWDPESLPRSRRAPHGLRHQKILAEDEGGTVAAQGLADHAAWRDARIERIRAGSAKTLQVTTPTQVAAEAVAAVARAVPGTVPPPPEPLLTTDAPREGRPTGKRIGSLIHNSLEDLVVAAAVKMPTDEEIVAVVQLHARLVGASDDEYDGAVQAAHSALRHPLLVRAAASAECRPECEISWLRPDGVLVEGTADLMFREEDEEGTSTWTVVEFKSSLETPEAKAKARIQLDTYISAVQAATGDAVEGFVLIV
jgi:ATP-dependent exoDNAse (exonuclease V) beta subunit